MPDAKRPSGPGQLKNEARAAATTQEEIDEAILERIAGGDAGAALDVERDAGRAARDAPARPQARQPRSSRGGRADSDRS